MILFSPWAFGGWPAWSIWTMNIGGYLLGLLLLLKLAIRRVTGFEPDRWGGRQPAAIRCGLGIITVLLLGWCFISAVNARAVVNLDTLLSIDKLDWIPWLPHSHDQPSTWFAFWQYLGLAGGFWALRDWIAIASPRERWRLKAPRGTRVRGHAERPGQTDGGLAHRMPDRLRRLAWVICVNGGAIALIGIFSTVDDPPKVLWLLSHEGKGGGFFGPFHYRNNGAQFLNLIWPLCLGLWLTYGLRAARSESMRASFGRSPSAILPVCLALMIAGPFISNSRGGSIVAILMLVGCLPVLLLGLHANRAVLLLTVVTVLIGGGLGVWIAWEPLSQRFFRDFVSYPTGIDGRLDGFTIRSKFQIPSVWGREAATIAGLSDSPRALWNAAGTMTLSLRRPGVFEARFVETDRTRVLTLVATNALFAQAGRTVEVIFTHQAGDSTVYLNRERLELRPVKSRSGFEWPEKLASKFLWVGRGSGGSRKFKDRIDVVTVFDRALEESVIRSLAERDPQPQSMIAANLGHDPWTELDPPPRLSVRPYSLSPRQWFAAGLGGRIDIYEAVRGMMADLPPVLGAGPGSFANLFKVFRQDDNPAIDWYAHDDYLETRITFGVVGAGLIYAGLLLCPAAALGRAGVPVSPVFLALMILGLTGGLVHARFDGVFQSHALLFLGVMLFGTVSALSIRAVNRRE